MKQFFAAAAIVALIMTTAVFAQRGEGGGRGQGGGRMNAPQAQGAPAQQRGPGMGMGQMRGAQPGMGMRQGPPPQSQMRGPGPGMGQGQMRGGRPMPPQSYTRGYAVPRPPMHPAYRPNYAPRYGYGPRGYYPYGGYAAPYYGYGYGYPSIALGVTPYGWALGGVYGGVSVYYEKSTTVQESTGASVEVTATAYISFEVDAVDAEVYVDGAYEGVVEHFLESPLEVLSGERHIELRLGGEKVGNFKVHPRGGQHVKIRAKLIR